MELYAIQNGMYPLGYGSKAGLVLIRTCPRMARPYDYRVKCARGWQLDASDGTPALPQLSSPR